MNTLADVIDTAADVCGDAPYLINPDGGQIVTMAALRDTARQLAAEYRAAGAAPRDAIALLMDNGLSTVQRLLAAMYGGFVAVPLNPDAGVAQLAYMLDHSDAVAAFVAPPFVQRATEALASVARTVKMEIASEDGFHSSGAGRALKSTAAQVSPDDGALLMYSSGSTSRPKASRHTHASLIAAAGNCVATHQLSADDRSLLVLPLYHMNAQVVTMLPTLMSGGSMVVPRRFDVSRFWSWMQQHRCTWSALVPTIVSQLVEWTGPHRGGDRGAIRFFRSSSGPLAPQLQRKFIDKCGVPLIQAMGSTEAGNVFANPLPPGINKIGSVGLPTGFEVKIVDRDGVERPVDEPGEIVIRGSALTAGYYKEAEETRAVFDPDGWLRTGDLAYRDRDGYFFVVGRSKELVIKVGVNIAPQQIDDVLAAHPAVLEAAVVGVPDPYLGEDLVAFVVRRPGMAADEQELLDFCAGRLGLFRTPQRIVFRGDLPRGPSGKVQRLRLVAESSGSTDEPAAGIRTDGADPTASVEEVIAQAWSEVLERGPIHPDDNFFALGGYSLLAIRCVSLVRGRLRCALSLSDFFDAGTVRELAAIVARRGVAPRPPLVEGETDLLTAAERRRSHPLSAAQRGIWFFEQANPGVPIYNESEAVRLLGPLDADALAQALNDVVARHEALRTTFHASGPEVVAIVHDERPIDLNTIDLSVLGPDARQRELERLLVDEPRRPYRLATETGIRATLLRLDREEHVLILLVHHIVCDRWSVGVLWREVARLYRGHRRHEPVALTPAVQFGDYVAWRAQQDDRAAGADDLSFWRRHLYGAPELLPLPGDRPRPRVASGRGAKRRFKLPGSTVGAAREFGRARKTSPFVVFAAALNVLLARYTGSDDIVIGVSMADRERRELESTIGLMIHTHAIRTEVRREHSFNAVVARVHHGFMQAYEHRAVPFDRVVKATLSSRSQAHTPLFQVNLNWRDRDQQIAFIGLDGLVVEPLLADNRTAKFDLTVTVTEMRSELFLEIEYSTDLFDEARIARLAGHYATLLEAAVRDGATRVSDLPMMTSDEADRLLQHTSRASLTST